MSRNEALSISPLEESRTFLVAAALTVVLALTAVLFQHPLIAAGVMALVPLGIFVLARPQWLISGVIFVLYTNAAVVAVRFHDVPSVAAMLVPAVLLVPFGYAIVLRRERFIITGTFPLMILFFLIQMIGVLSARYRNVAMEAVQTSLLEGALLYFLVTNVVRTRPQLVQATWALLLAGCFMGGLSLVQQLTGTFDENYGGFAQVPGLGFNVIEGDAEVRQARLCGPIGEQNRYAQIMLMLVPLGIFQFWSHTKTSTRLWAALAVGFSAIGCALAFSRGAAVGFALMLILMTAMRQLPVKHLVLFVAGIGLLLLASPQYRHRLASLNELTEVATKGNTSSGELDGAIRGRATVMLAAVRVTADYPLLGVGPGMFNFYSRDYGIEGGLRALEGTREAHCLYLELAAEHGLLGLACFLAMVGFSLRNLNIARRLWQARDPQLANMATGYFLAIATYLCTGLFLHFSYVRYFWLILALADAASYVAAQRAQSSMSESPTTSPEAAPCPN